MCGVGLAASICRPRLYQQESLPYAPDWSDVRRMVADADTDKPRDIRDRAILLLLAVYGMRSGEVAALSLDQIDWPGRTIQVFRLKRRQPQIYPLLASVAEALAAYIDTVRPSSYYPEVFLCMHAPRRPMKAGSIYDVANRRFVALGIEAVHRGGHALRHACASRLLVDQQWLWKENRALARRLRAAHLKERGVIEDVDYQRPATSIGSYCAPSVPAIGAPASKHSSARAHRHRQELVGVRAGAESLPRWFLRIAQTDLGTVSRAGRGARRWQHRPIPGPAFPHRHPTAGRLRHGALERCRAPRLPGDLR